MLLLSWNRMAYAFPIFFVRYSRPKISEQHIAEDMVVPRHPCMLRFCPHNNRLWIRVLAGTSVTIGLRQSLIMPYALPCGVDV